MADWNGRSCWGCEKSDWFDGKGISHPGIIAEIIWKLAVRWGRDWPLSVGCELHGNEVTRANSREIPGGWEVFGRGKVMLGRWWIV
jgi:hypothetical protein